MKKAILSIALAAVFVSCGNNNKNANQNAAVPGIATEDTIGLRDFKEWKEKQEVLSNQQTYTSEGVELQPVPEEKQAPVIVYRDAPVKQTRVAKNTRTSSRPVYRKPAPEPENEGIAKAPAPRNSGPTREPYGRGTAGTEAPEEGEGTIANDGDVAVNTPTEVPAKKEGGWSKAAKGTAIGGTSGAVIGAVISKNKTKGAVIGGIVGAAGGYIFGRKQDKKDGRY